MAEDVKEYIKTYSCGDSFGFEPNSLLTQNEHHYKNKTNQYFIKYVKQSITLTLYLRYKLKIPNFFITFALGKNISNEIKSQWL